MDNSLFDKFDRGIGSIILAILISGARMLLRSEKTFLERVLIFFGSIALSVGAGFLVQKTGGWIAKYDYIVVAVCAYAGKELTTSLPQKVPGIVITIVTAMLPKPQTKQEEPTIKEDDEKES